MKKLEKLQCELPTSAVLDRRQSISLKGGGNKRKDRPSAVMTADKGSISSTVTISQRG